MLKLHYCAPINHEYEKSGEELEDLYKQIQENNENNKDKNQMLHNFNVPS